MAELWKHGGKLDTKGHVLCDLIYTNSEKGKSIKMESRLMFIPKGGMKGNEEWLITGSLSRVSKLEKVMKLERGSSFITLIIH